MAELHNDPDCALVTKAKEGDSEAFGELVEKFQHRIYRWIWTIVGNPETAEDLTQVTFFEAWRGLHNFRQDASFSTWLYTIAKNSAINFMIREKKKRSHLQDGPPGEDLENTVDPRPTPEEDTICMSEREQLMTVLFELPEEYRMPLVLFYFEGSTYEEITKVLALPLSTVKIRIHRAKKASREICVKKGYALLSSEADGGPQ